jgi:hypothetical protein
MRIVGRERIPIIDPEDFGERRKQQIEVELRGDRRHRPGKADHAGERDDADGQLGGIDDIGGNVL